MRVRFLGSGDAFGSGGRLQTCILLESGDMRRRARAGREGLESASDGYEIEL